MKTGPQGIPLNCSIVVHVWRSVKCAILMLHNSRTKYKYKHWKVLVKWNHATRLDFFCAKSTKQPELLFTNRRLFLCLIIRKEEWHFVYLGEWKMDCAENGSVALTVYYWNWTMLAHI